MIQFETIDKFHRGDLYDLIYQGYKKIVQDNPDYWNGEIEKWKKFDKNCFDNPRTIGSCLFITTVDGKAIGLASWDPRKLPKTAEVGQNCIVPDQQNKGYGKRQIKEIIKRMKGLKAKKLTVTTGGHPFFKPARKMYQGLGFKEARRRNGGPDPRYRLIDYELAL